MLRITMQDLVKDALYSGDESASFLHVNLSRYDITKCKMFSAI